MTMTIETLLKQLEDEKDRECDLYHEYRAKARKCFMNNDYESEDYYDYLGDKAYAKVDELSIAIRIIKERVA